MFLSQAYNPEGYVDGFMFEIKSTGGFWGCGLGAGWRLVGTGAGLGVLVVVAWYWELPVVDGFMFMGVSVSETNG